MSVRQTQNAVARRVSDFEVAAVALKIARRLGDHHADAPHRMPLLRPHTLNSVKLTSGIARGQDAAMSDVAGLGLRGYLGFVALVACGGDTSPAGQRSSEAGRIRSELKERYGHSARVAEVTGHAPNDELMITATVAECRSLDDAVSIKRWLELGFRAILCGPEDGYLNGTEVVDLLHGRGGGIAVDGSDSHLGSTPNQGKAPRADDGLDRAMITKGMDGVKAEALACGSKSSVKANVLAQVKVKVSPEGQVSDVSVREAPSAEIGECVAIAVRKARFQSTKTGGEFGYPFIADVKAFLKSLGP